MAATIPAARPAAHPLVMMLVAWQRLTRAHGATSRHGRRFRAVYAARPETAPTLVRIRVQRRAVRACLRTQVAVGWVVTSWRARRRVITMIMAQ
jgi:hypothetical protein